MCSASLVICVPEVEWLGVMNCFQNNMMLRKWDVGIQRRMVNHPTLCVLFTLSRSPNTSARSRPNASTSCSEQNKQIKQGSSKRLFRLTMFCNRNIISCVCNSRVFKQSHQISIDFQGWLVHSLNQSSFFKKN